MKLLVILAVLPPVLAWDAEYAGFIHFHDWDGRIQDIVTKMKLPSGNVIPTAIVKDMCAADSSCNTFRTDDSGSWFRTMNVNATRDMYIANNPSIQPAAICEAQSGGGNFPGTFWLFCNGADGFDWESHVDLIGHFDLPPDVLHQSCLQNSLCTAFSVDNGGARGTLFKKAKPSQVASGYFALPTDYSAKTRFA